MRYGSVCSGIEAATVAWHSLGWSPAFFSEIERFPCEVLSHHYGSNMPGEVVGNGVPNLGDMTKFTGWPDDAIDILVGGTPCQSFSTSGLRAGLADPRGQLMLTYLAIVAKYRPRWLVWENVAGVLSANSGRDFGTFLWSLGELGYGFAYRVLDAQYFGVPQRRRRVFVVGHSGDWRSAAAALFERQSFEKTEPPQRHPRRAWAFDNGLSATFNMPVGHDFSPCLIKTRGYVVSDGEIIRKMTPVEAERAQGFPDNYTSVRGARTSEDARFAAIGNSMAVPVMRWIGKRIAMLEAQQNIVLGEAA